MTGNLYKVVSGSYTEISDYVLNISNMRWRRDRGYYPTVAHPTITFDDNLSLSEGDELELWIDGDLEIVLYIDKINEQPAKHTFTAECYDLVYKLSGYYINQISASDFNTTSYWTGLTGPEQLERYKYIPGGSTYYDEQYIQALFLARVMIHKACGLDLEDITDSSVIDRVTSYLRIKTSSGATPSLVTRRYLLFQWHQMLYIGAQKSTTPYYECATFLQVFLEICRTLQMRWEWTIVSEVRTLKFNVIGSYTIPSEDLDGYQKKRMDVVDSLQATVNELASLTAYYSSFTDSPSSEYTRPTYTGNFTKKTITFPAHFMLHYRPSATYTLEEISYNSNTEFLEQFATGFSTFFNTDYYQIDITLAGSATQNPLVNELDFRNNHSKITHYEEIR
jgi:hypothetical protein